MEEAMELSASSLRPLVRQALQHLLDQGDHPTLTSKVCKTLLQEVPSTEVQLAEDKGMREQEDGVAQVPSGGLALLIGYPNYPLCNKLSDSLAYWMVTGKCPVDDLPVMYLLNEQDSLDDRKQRMELVWSQLSGAYSLWDHWSQDEKIHRVCDVLRLLGLRGVLDLIGVRKTVGSSDIIPPPKEVLLQTFSAPHSPSAKLTVGARALAKHCHRDDSLQWWGKCSGTEADKNAHAWKLICRIMLEATWVNIHTLPHDVKVVEMRTVEGYGARWLLDGSEFRGFLEPQMEDGHEVKWRH